MKKRQYTVQKMLAVNERILSYLSSWLPELGKTEEAHVRHMIVGWPLMTKAQQLMAVPSKLVIPMSKPNLEILSLIPIGAQLVAVLGDEASKVAGLISSKLQCKTTLSIVPNADVIVLLHTLDYANYSDREDRFSQLIGNLTLSGKLIVLAWDLREPAAHIAVDILCNLRKVHKYLHSISMVAPPEMYLETYTLPKTDCTFWQIYGKMAGKAPLLTYIDGTEWEARQSDAYAQIVSARSLCPLSSQSRKFLPQDAFLQPEAKQLDYWVGAENSVDFVSVKWGQMKLFVTTLFCITGIWDWSLGPPTVVYAGAAEGWNIEILAWMFPEIRWILYDIREFEIGLGRGLEEIRRTEGRLEIHSGPINGMFTDEVAAKYTSVPNILFMSDIRYRKTEADVISDHEQQAKWVRIISPVLSMLKFRLPYPGEGVPETFAYFSGEILFQPYTARTSSETRLIVWGVPEQMVNYNVLQYERELSFHNLVTRHCTRWNVDGTSVDFDFAYALFCLQSYLELTGQIEEIEITGGDDSKKISQSVFDLFDKVVQWLNIYTLVPFSIEQERVSGQRKR